ncbi:hypothetical protein ATP_00150 [Candidatus Phytoplasma mali]|uniref:Uncharacterized protein n=1 Tax=Phytoplasma mali (strain AT) TaxID=482235 RepID=B3R0H3_PHYMT|nr:hypothetical protein [Candidatus Phytoplasma mali]CAP18337.1 hypothetical protein ATP_00150 [Candidatus Phytoplasma mali]
MIDVNIKSKKNIFSLGPIQIIILCLFIIFLFNTLYNYYFAATPIATSSKITTGFIIVFMIYFWETTYNGNLIFKENKNLIIQLVNQTEKLQNDVKDLKQKENLLLITKNRK